MRNDSQSAKIGKRVIHRAVTHELSEVGGKWITKPDRRNVTLMAIVKCWAMVRRPRAMPYVYHISEIE